MRITAAMVQFMLEQAGYACNLQGSPDDEVTRLRLLRPGKKRAGTLYFDAAHNISSTHADKMKKAAPTAKPRTPWKTGACLTSTDGTADAVELLEIASDAMTLLQAWDERLKDALAANMPLADFVQLGEEVIPFAFGFYDENVSALGASSNFINWIRAYSGEENLPDTYSDGTFPTVQLTDLFEDEDYQNAVNHHAPFYYESAFPNGLTNHSYCLNVFDGDTYVARFVVLTDPTVHELPRGAEQICGHFVSALSARYLRFTGSDVTFGNQHDSLHELFAGMLFGKDQLDAARMEDTLASYGWARANRFSVIKLVFFEAVRWETAALFICQQLERRIRCSCAMPHGRTIAWIVNEALLGDSASNTVMDTLVDTIRTYACKAGISNTLNDFTLVQAGFQQCEAALVAGQARDPHLWYHRFGDYTLDYMLQKASEGFPPELLVSEKIKALAQADSEDGSEYIVTLRSFLEHKQNATHTADALYMHRTSLLRRIERIGKIAGIDFDDPDEVLYLHISLKLLG